MGYENGPRPLAVRFAAVLWREVADEFVRVERDMRTGGIPNHAKHDPAPPRHHLVGWIAIAGNGNEHEIRTKIELGLNSFVGDYGLRQVRQAQGGVGFGVRLPEAPLSLTTWSLFQDEGAICFVEGVFYDKCFSHFPIDGEDPWLAKGLLASFRTAKTKAIAELSGSFSGFVFDRNEQALITFVDRMGTKVLYWSTEGDDVIVASNLAAFRALKTLDLDQQGAFQYMTVGFPIGERTPLKDVSIQLPASVNIFRGRTRESRRYWTVPKRLPAMSLKDACALITHALEEFVGRLHDRTQEPLGLGLSGGHDSRVILSALAYKGIPYEPLTRIPDGFNDRIARALCSIVKKDPRLVEAVSRDEMPEIQKGVFAYSDGLYFESFGFAVLGKACHEHQIKYLMLGFAGDVISGDVGTPAPQYVRGIEELAPAVLQQHVELLSFDDAVSVIHGDESAKRSLIDTAILEWARSFPEKEHHEHLLEVAMWQAMANRNVKRVRFSMIPATRYTQLIFPYLDNRVLDAYFSLPIEFLYHQKAHCYAGFHRFSEFGNYRACPYPISLRNEARFPLVLYRMRLAKRLFARFAPTTFKGEVSRTQRDAADQVAKSSLFDSRAVHELLGRGRISPRGVRRLRNLVRFHNVYVRGKLSDEA